MGKIILLLALAFIAYIVFKGAMRRDRPPTSGPRPVERMVACEHCALNLPASEALQDGGNFYCCDEHRRLGAD